jgi:outer membrane protein OmpA-like peptidoglycan-associated protein
MSVMRKLLLFLSMIFMLSFTSNAQSWIKKLGNTAKDAAQRAVEEKVERKSDEVTNKVMDRAEESVTKKGDEDNTDVRKRESDENDDASEHDQTVSGSDEKGSTVLQSFSSYDFVPGDQILYFEDFSSDAIGDFPATWTSNSGGEVKTVNIADGHWFHMYGEDATYCYMHSVKFPDNFIMEFDIIPDNEYKYGTQLTFYQEDQQEHKEMNDDLYPGIGGLHIRLMSDCWETKGYSDDKEWINGKSTIKPVRLERVNHVIVWIQKRRVRIYHEGQKVLDIPTNIYEGTLFNRFRFSAWDSYSFPYITNLKITTASPDTRSKLITEGKLVSYGIYFDVNKAEVKPESYATMKSIAGVLSDNPGVRVRIIGHTDSDGDDNLNKTLSAKRAESVKNELVTSFGVEPARLETSGAGEGEPIAPNDSPENKAKNRRVEFVKI